MNASLLVEELTKRQLKISTAESMTGGMIASMITKVAGASAVFEQGFITYAEKAKVEILGVKQETINDFSVISKEVALEMVEGLLHRTNADVGISITGLAGPKGDAFGHEVGLCFIGIGYQNHFEVYSNVLKGTRNEIQEQAALVALKLAFLTITR